MLTSVEISSELSFVLEFGHRYIRFFANQGILLEDGTDTPYEVETPYLENEIEKLSFLQNADILYIFHPSHPIMMLSRYANTDWRLEEFELKDGPWENVNTSDNVLKVSNTTGDITITSTLPLFTQEDIGRLVRITVKNSEKKAWEAETQVELNQICYSDGKYYKALSSGETGTYKPTHTIGTLSDGSIVWEYQHAGYGTAKITGFTDENTVVATVLSQFPDEIVNQGSDYWELGLIYSGREYPSCGDFFRNRFCFMVNDNGIPKVCLSCSDDFNNFADKDNGEVLDTNAITVLVTANKYVEGMWLCAAEVLFVGTSAAEFYIDSASAAKALSSDNVKIQQISEIGSLPIKPVKIGSHIIFVNKIGTSIRDVIYSYETDSYDPIDLSLYGKHLFASGIIDMCYQEKPDKVIWFAVNDGRLIGLTFSSEQGVNGAHQHYLSGKIKNLTVIPNFEALTDNLWLEVQRNINGADVTSIEYLDNGYPLQYSEDINDMLNYADKEDTEATFMKENSFYVDGGLQGEFTDLINTSITPNSENLLNRNIFVLDNAPYTENISETGTAIEITMGVSDVLQSGEDRNEFQIRWTPETGDSENYAFLTNENLEGYNWNVGYYGGITKTGIVENGSISFSQSFWTGGGMITLHIYKGLPKNRIVTGLDHLEGMNVSIMADGAELPSQIVSGGSIEVARKYRKITVGLPISSIMIPQTMYIQGNNGSGVGDVQRIDHITLMLWRSLGGKVGDSYDNLQEIYFRKTDDEMDSSAPLYTGNKEIPLNLSTSTIKEKGARIMIYNDTVFPMNILAIAPHFTTSGNAK